MTDPGRTEWTVDCTDSVGRPRQLRVFVLGDQVAVQAPPGEAARVTPEQRRALAVALREAGELADQQAGTGPDHPRGDEHPAR